MIVIEYLLYNRPTIRLLRNGSWNQRTHHLQTLLESFLGDLPSISRDMTSPNCRTSRCGSFRVDVESMARSIDRSTGLLVGDLNIERWWKMYLCIHTYSTLVHVAFRCIELDRYMYIFISMLSCTYIYIHTHIFHHSYIYIYTSLHIWVYISLYTRIGMVHLGSK